MEREIGPRWCHSSRDIERRQAATLGIVEEGRRRKGWGFLSLRGHCTVCRGAEWRGWVKRWNIRGAGRHAFCSRASKYARSRIWLLGTFVFRQGVERVHKVRNRVWRGKRFGFLSAVSDDRPQRRSDNGQLGWLGNAGVKSLETGWMSCPQTATWMDPCGRGRRDWALRRQLIPWGVDLAAVESRLNKLGTCGRGPARRSVALGGLRLRWSERAAVRACQRNAGLRRLARGAAAAGARRRRRRRRLGRRRRLALAMGAAGDCHGRLAGVSARGG
jgi:hypothetical protein